MINYKPSEFSLKAFLKFEQIYISFDQITV